MNDTARAAVAAAPVLSLAGLTRRYKSGEGQLTVLDGVDLDIMAGEIVGLVGPSGSGKSSLLHAAGMLERPSGGDVRIAGASGWSLGDDARTEIRRNRIGFVYQFHHLLPEFDAIHNVALPALIAGRPRKEALAEAKRLLGLLGLAARIHHQPAQLSGGEQQRVAIARAFATDPEVVFADEPTGNLDADTGARIIDLLFELNASAHTTLILVTHDDALAARCQRRLHLVAGRAHEAARA